MTRCFPCLFSHQIEFPDIWKDNIILVRKLIAWFTHPKPYSKHISEYIASTGPYCIKLMFIIKIWSSDVFFSFLPPNQWLVTMSFQLYLFKQHWPCWVRGNYWFLLVDDFENRCREIHRLRLLQKHMDLKRTTHRR